MTYWRRRLTEWPRGSKPRLYCVRGGDGWVWEPSRRRWVPNDVIAGAANGLSSEGWAFEEIGPAEARRMMRRSR